MELPHPPCPGPHLRRPRSPGGAGPAAPAIAGSCGLQGRWMILRARGSDFRWSLVPANDRGRPAPWRQGSLGRAVRWRRPRAGEEGENLADGRWRHPRISPGGI